MRILMITKFNLIHFLNQREKCFNVVTIFPSLHDSVANKTRITSAEAPVRRYSDATRSEIKETKNEIDESPSGYKVHQTCFLTYMIP